MNTQIGMKTVIFIAHSQEDRKQTFQTLKLYGSMKNIYTELSFQYCTKNVL